jgi:hypothetical protein
MYVTQLPLTPYMDENWWPARLYNHKKTVRFYLPSRLFTNLFPHHETDMVQVSKVVWVMVLPIMYDMSGHCLHVYTGC